MKDAQLKHLIDRNNFMKSRITIFLLALFVTQFFKTALAEENSPDIKTVISEGVGLDPQSAAQNAAENALKNVVGSFIDTNTLLEKRTLIDNGIKSETKNISNDVKEYSQGSIKSFEIIDTKNEGGLFKLTAKIAVRNENFTVYIKQIAKGEVSVDRDNLTKIATKIENQKTFENVSNNVQKKQQQNVNAILRDSVIKPIISGEVQDIFIGNPMAVSDALKNSDIDEETKAILKEEKNQNKIFFKVTFKLKIGFIENLNNILKEISTEQKSIDLDNHLYADLKKCSDAFCLETVDKKNPRIANLTLITPKENDAFYGIRCSSDCFSDNETIRITLRDTENAVFMIRNIRQEKVVRNNPKFIIPTSENVSLIMKTKSFFKSPPWLLIRKSDDVSTSYIQKIFNEDSFYILLDLDADRLKKMDKIEVTIEKE
jgi:hypothetical protein